MELIEFELLEKQCQQEETMLDEKQKQYGEIEKLQHQIVHVNSELVIEQLKKQGKDCVNILSDFDTWMYYDTLWWAITS